MSGLIILFWFVADAVALRYFVGISRVGFNERANDVPPGTVCWRYVLYVRPVGCHWCVSSPAPMNV